MPSGVEHKRAFAITAIALDLITASMPSGVEHAQGYLWELYGVGPDHRLDAFGR